MLKQLSARRQTGIFAVIVAIIVFILAGAANGVLGEFGSTIFHSFWGAVTQFVTISAWPWIITILILLVGLISVTIEWWITRLNLKKTNQVVDLDYRVLKLVPNLVSAGNLEEEMHRLVYKMLELATELFDGYVHRASLFLPDPDRKHLRIWDGYQMPEESIRRTVFDIEVGKSGTMRGVAGEAFLDGQPHVVHMKNEKGGWKTDREESYIFFENRAFIPYKSCVCTPISVGTDLADRLGVVCFDSSSLSVFNSAETENSELQKRLIVLAGRFATALVLYEELKKVFQGRQHNDHRA